MTAEPKLCPPCRRGDCEECMGPDRPAHLNPYACPCNNRGRCPSPEPSTDSLGGYDFGIPGSDD
ncbi:hypothetical protein ACFVWX_13625 [Streptomyces sp. NPDC058220]|uniref:hypothetical protein n=1 Tax=Streptomyces sp. NPDC058220 TaxID=3346387 RepID=UPI0036E2E342